MNKGHVLVISRSHIPRYRDHLRDAGMQEPFRWIYFGKNYPLLLELEKTFGPQNPRIPVGEQLQRVARKHRQSYVDYIGSLVPENDRLRWWTSSVSEKSPLISNVLLHFCYLLLFREQVANAEGPLVVVCENPAIARALADNCPPTRRERLVFVPEPFSLPGRLRRTGSLLAKKAWFFAQSVARMGMARIGRHGGLHARRPRPPERSGGVALHAWADSRAFRNKGSFENIFFSGIGRQLQARSIPYFYLVEVLPTYPYRAALANLKTVDEEFLLLDELIRLSDIWTALWYMARPPLPPGTLPSWEGIDMTGIIRDEFGADALNTRREESYLRYRAAARLNLTRPPDVFLYPFENQIWEKAYLAGFAGSGRKTKTVGYAHTLVRLMYTSYTRSAGENGVMPVPDRIVTSGEMGMATLRDSGFSGTDIRVGGAIRYPLLHREEEDNSRTSRSDPKVVLLALSGGLDESLELLSKTVRALDGLGVRILVKCHPVLPFGQISRFFGPVPDHIAITEEPVEKLLEETDLVFYTETTVSVEALARGIPVIHVKSDCRIDMNIFEGLPSVPSVNDIPALRQAAIGALASPRHPVSATDRDYINGLFAPVSSTITDLFIGP